MTRLLLIFLSLVLVAGTSAQCSPMSFLIFGSISTSDVITTDQNCQEPAPFNLTTTLQLASVQVSDSVAVTVMNATLAEAASIGGTVATFSRSLGVFFVLDTGSSLLYQFSMDGTRVNLLTLTNVESYLPVLAFDEERQVLLILTGGQVATLSVFKVGNEDPVQSWNIQQIVIYQSTWLALDENEGFAYFLAQKSSRNGPLLLVVFDYIHGILVQSSKVPVGAPELVTAHFTTDLIYGSACGGAQSAVWVIDPSQHVITSWNSTDIHVETPALLPAAADDIQVLDPQDPTHILHQMIVASAENGIWTPVVVEWQGSTLIGTRCQFEFSDDPRPAGWWAFATAGSIL